MSRCEFFFNFHLSFSFTRQAFGSPTPRLDSPTHPHSRQSTIVNGIVPRTTGTRTARRGSPAPASFTARQTARPAWVVVVGVLGTCASAGWDVDVGIDSTQRMSYRASARRGRARVSVCLHTHDSEHRGPQRRAARTGTPTRSASPATYTYSIGLQYREYASRYQMGSWYASRSVSDQ